MPVAYIRASGNQAAGAPELMNLENMNVSAYLKRGILSILGMSLFQYADVQNFAVGHASIEGTKASNKNSRFRINVWHGLDFNADIPISRLRKGRNRIVVEVKHGLGLASGSKIHK